MNNNVILFGIGITIIALSVSISFVSNDVFVFAVEESEKIYWYEDSPLSWSDFEGTVGSFPDYYTGEKGDFAAFTATWLEYEYNWEYTQESPCMYQIDYAESWASFVKTHSWVRPENSNDMELLNHEQRHFDVYKIGELKLNEIFKNEFLNKEFLCPPTNNSLDDEIEQKIAKDFQQADLSVMKTINQMNIDYDVETEHYFDKTQQQIWNKKIDCLLENYGDDNKCIESQLEPETPSKNMDSDPAPVPTWIKNNAGWWAEGQIDDTAFLQGIQFLIKEGIIDVPATESSGSGGEIPDWIRNNASWWAEGQIDDTAFLQGIQFLVEQGIIQV